MVQIVLLIQQVCIDPALSPVLYIDTVMGSGRVSLSLSVHRLLEMGRLSKAYRD